ncbi:MSHA biogenesis protein MshI [Photobacterium iliopiscarium]|uniref:MSHA biogenesis protein MshI n=1 Tax=Photobacterium iliopiscarium TaxID=56192 RepID=UPI001E336E31|nr:MSHA biogenesis protein MshI [Photobacterium iliopiscarium]MCD9466259.1 MSHA biogenesis protein MshI [Photobacterium iliopiscarium]
MKQRLLKFFKKNASKSVASLVFEDSTVVLVLQNHDHFIVDRTVVSTSSDWNNAAHDLIIKHQLSGYLVKIVLGHGSYQSLIIDQPNLSAEELPIALPFLIKDLVNDSPADLIADGFPAIVSGHLQVIVASRKLITDIILTCNNAGCNVNDITVEDVVWSAFTEANRSQLIIHSDESGDLQLTAFHEQNLCFQRQLRGISLSTLDTSIVENRRQQLDNLALELQRSLDYISAQLRGDAINQLIVSCNKQQNEKLANELNQRLNINVKVIDDVAIDIDCNVSRLGWAALQRSSNSALNLYRDSLLPLKEWMTLSHLAMSWGILFVIFMGWFGFNQWQNMEQQKQLDHQQSVLTVEKNQLHLMTDKIASMVVDPLKASQAKKLETELITKKNALKAIYKHDDSLKVGYAELLNQLADASNGDISLQHIYVAGELMDLNGMARNPDAVPRWVGVFNRYSSLMDRRFQKMSLGRNDKNVVTFSLQAVKSQHVIEDLH